MAPPLPPLVPWEKLVLVTANHHSVSISAYDQAPVTSSSVPLWAHHSQLPPTPDWSLSNSSNLPTFAHLPARVPRGCATLGFKSSLSFASWLIYCKTASVLRGDWFHLHSQVRKCKSKKPNDFLPGSLPQNPGLLPTSKP